MNNSELQSQVQTSVETCCMFAQVLVSQESAAKRYSNAGNSDREIRDEGLPVQEYNCDQLRNFPSMQLFQSFTSLVCWTPSSSCALALIEHWDGFLQECERAVGVYS